jgi:hypothetical protein
LDYNRSTEIAEMRFLRPEEAESKERKQTKEIYLWFIYGRLPYFKLQMSRDKIIVNINRKVCEKMCLWSILRDYLETSPDGVSKTARILSGQSLTEPKN